MKSNTKGFTLVELSIVIVIIGLIIAGVTAGQSLVRQSALQRVIGDFRSLQAAANTFKLQYSRYPGDFNNAFSFWGTNCAATAAACNGNGNGFIFSAFQEEYMAFKHLSLAGLIPGTYTGATGAAPGAVPKVNLPAGPLANSGYSFAASDSSNYGEGFWNSTSNGNFIWFGTPSDIMRSVVLKPAEMYSIDTKIDNGLPHSGIILVAIANSGCSVAATAPTTYALSSITALCAVKYRL